MRKSGFEPLEKTFKLCHNPEHDPPAIIHIPVDQQYRHICPGCKKETVIIN